MILTLDESAERIQDGDLVAIPTETVYGLAADAFNPQAVQKIFEIKGRPADNPLIVHISSLEQVSMLTPSLSSTASVLAEAFWPGPLTLVLEKKEDVPDIVTGGLPTVAVRMPDHPLTLRLIRLTGPLTAPSANRSGMPSPTRASHILDDYGESVDLLDGGPCRIGLESTVVDVTSEKLQILRPGAVTEKIITQKTGLVVTKNSIRDRELRRSPGTRYTHYKPQADVKWIREIPETLSPDSYYLFHSEVGNNFFPSRHLASFNDDFSEFAKTLYDHFRTADRLGCSEILIEYFHADHPHPLISALHDRITRATGESSPR